MATIHDVQAGGWVGPVARQDHSPAAFGEWLRQARNDRGLTLDDINSETKIPLRSLRALEHGDLEVIPPFYRRAEVRAIARALGVDEALAIGLLDSATTSAVEPAEQRPGQREDVASRERVKRNDALAIVALALAATLVASGLREAMLQRTEPPQRAADVVPAIEPTAATSQTTGDVPVGAPVSAAAPPSTPATASGATAVAPVTELVIQTDPPNARITVNGISWGESPMTIRHLPAGAKRIRATKDGFAAAEQVLGVSDGQRQTLTLRLHGAN